MKIRLASPLTKDSIVDGIGLRAVVWTQGCNHGCFGCHNPETHDFNGGFEVDTFDLIQEIHSLKLHRGITLSGGEPMEQAAACLELSKSAKESGLDVWMYTGYTFEDIVHSFSNRKDWQELINQVDVMVDGPFMIGQRSLLLPFRGSKNQRIIDVKASLNKGEVVILQQYQQKVV